MASNILPRSEWLLYITALAHIVICPFTKVEESFNLQAMHDILYHGPELQKYDHHMFPGVVPRTFIGPVIISSIAYPFVTIMNWLAMEKLLSQYIVRATLGVLVLSGLQRFRATIGLKYGLAVQRWHLAITISQFHLMFYLSRPLPNIFALAITLYALSFWMENKMPKYIFASAGAIIVFRGELAIYLGTILAMDLMVGRVSIKTIVGYGMCSLAIWLPLSIGVDTFFWNSSTLLWPEGQVLYYNIILNKSSNWGVMPWAWYFYSAMPRALFASLLFVPVGILMDRRTLILILPCTIFVTLYSFLPHKELRFIIYVVPVLNVPAAVVCAKLWSYGGKNWIYSWRRICVALIPVCHLILNVIYTVLMLEVSRHNYPGGEALLRLHQLEKHESQVAVHIGNFAAQTGVSRFGQLYDNTTQGVQPVKWIYDKTENLSLNNLTHSDFTHLIIENIDMENDEILNIKNYELLERITAFGGYSIKYNYYHWPITIKRKNAILILKKRQVTKNHV